MTEQTEQITVATYTAYNRRAKRALSKLHAKYGGKFQMVVNFDRVIINDEHDNYHKFLDAVRDMSKRNIAINIRIDDDRKED